MVRDFVLRHFGAIRPETFSLLLLFGVSAAVAGVLWVLRSAQTGGDSRFRLREADRPGNRAKSPGRGPESLADARIKTKATEKPLQLEGIRTDGSPYQILGVKPGAKPAEIQKAFRELMKRFHPDKVGPQGSREWKDAQRIAEAVIRAKDELLKKR